MTKVKHDLRHYQSFWEMPAQTNAREPVKSFRRVARLCFYRHNPFRFWTVLSDPEHPNRAYQIMTEFGAGREAVSLSSARTTKRLQPSLRLLVSIVHSTGGYKPPFPIPETQSAFHPHARFRTAQSPTALLALVRR
jgi:hypothetical protein